MSIQMNQTDEHEHKLVLLGSKLDEKSGKACAGKNSGREARSSYYCLGNGTPAFLLFFPAPAFSLVFTD